MNPSFLLPGCCAWIHPPDPALRGSPISPTPLQAALTIRGLFYLQNLIYIVITVTKNLKKAFTLIELLVVVSIIGILSSVVLASLNSARGKAQNARAMADLRSFRTGIALLEDDTGKWPNGCDPGTVTVGLTNEVNLNDQQAGMVEQPTPGVTARTQGGAVLCEWGPEVAAWNGPYMPSAIDPWGSSYWFDGDYEARSDPDPGESCSPPNPSTIIAVVSLGPDKGENGDGILTTNDYDCNDVYLKIQ